MHKDVRQDRPQSQQLPAFFEGKRRQGLRAIYLQHYRPYTRAFTGHRQERCTPKYATPWVGCQLYCQDEQVYAQLRAQDVQLCLQQDRGYLKMWRVQQ